MPQDPERRSSATTGLTVAAVVGVIVCCAGTLLVAAGVLASAGLLFDNLLIIALAAGVLGWAVTRAIRSLRARDPSGQPDRRNRAWRRHPDAVGEIPHRSSRGNPVRHPGHRRDMSSLPIALRVARQDDVVDSIRSGSYRAVNKNGDLDLTERHGRFAVRILIR